MQVHQNQSVSDSDGEPACSHSGVPPEVSSQRTSVCDNHTSQVCIVWCDTSHQCISICFLDIHDKYNQCTVMYTVRYVSVM